MNTYPFLSVIIPCRNEERFIEECLRSVDTNDYPHDSLEVFVVDGMSTDRTREIVQRLQGLYAYVRLLENPGMYTPTALNIGIRASRGDVIMRLDAHARYKNNYIRSCVYNLEKYKADNVGGIFVTEPRENTLLAKAISQAISHRFGVGNSYFRTHPTVVQEVDTVAFGCYRRDVFERIGLYNEKLRRSQDMELNLRLKKAGGKIILFPGIVVYYYSRGTLKDFWNHNIQNGIWATYPYKFTRRWLSLRHYVPLFFVGTLVALAVGSLFWSPAKWFLMVIIISYGLSALAASFSVSRKQKDWRYLWVLPVVFAILHVTYGIGSLIGLVKLLLPPFTNAHEPTKMLPLKI